MVAIRALRRAYKAIAFRDPCRSGASLNTAPVDRSAHSTRRCSSKQIVPVAGRWNRARYSRRHAHVARTDQDLRRVRTPRRRPQHALPKRLWPTRKLAGLEGKVTTAVIRWFAKPAGVNMAGRPIRIRRAMRASARFFTRPLRGACAGSRRRTSSARSTARSSQFGPIEFDQVFRAKGRFYSTTALVGGDRALAARFGTATSPPFYLSPRDYHRIHMPAPGDWYR